MEKNHVHFLANPIVGSEGEVEGRRSLPGVPVSFTAANTFFTTVLLAPNQMPDVDKELNKYLLNERMSVLSLLSL